MNKEEFLLDRTRDLIELFEKYGSYTPTFAVLYDDGTVNSFATSFSGQNSKESFNFFMHRICANPKAVASVFTSEGWSSSSADETKSPSECVDKEEIVMLLYSTRQNIHECHLYKPTKNGKLELISISNAHHGMFCNPFHEVKILTKGEKEREIQEFQKTVCDTLCHAFKELHYLAPMLYFLSNTPAKVSLRWIPAEEWKDKVGLKRMISAKCLKPDTLAIMLAIPTDNNMVNVILEADDIQDVFCYRIDPLTHTLEFESRGTYDGEFSGVFKNNYE
jgi:hypothetical protein